MPAWPAKDPDVVADYLYTIPLDAGDTVTGYTFTRVSGTVAIDSESRAGATVTAFLSGGADGETSVFKVTWETAGGRSDEDYVSLPVIAKDYSELALTGYAKPTAAHLMARYPAFASVDAGTVQIWLTDAERFVDDTWLEADYAAALMALAAHNMAMIGLGTQTAAGALPAGVTRFKSGAMDLTISDSAAAAMARGGYDATMYGREYERLRHRSFAGPRTIVAGTIPSYSLLPGEI